MDTELKDLKDAGRQSDAGEELSGIDASEKDSRPLLNASSPSSPSDSPVRPLDDKYAPYARRDVYGPLGKGDIPAKEKVILGIGLVILMPLRLVLGISILILYFVVCRLCTLFSVPNRGEQEEGSFQEDFAHMTGYRRSIVVITGRFAARAMLFVMGFYWIKEATLRGSEIPQSDTNVQGELKEHSLRPGAVVSNHASYVDILYHMSSMFPSFVAKRSVARLPFVGLISKCLGCIYVQRESKAAAFKGVSGIVTERIESAHQDDDAPLMLLFPEGTTTNGDYLLPFKTGAFLAKAPVLPVILRYPYQRFSPAWESISGVRHVLLLLCQLVNYIEVIHLPVYYPSQQEKDDPKLYADNVRQLIASEGNLKLSNIGLAEKRVYLSALNDVMSQ